MSEKIVIKMHGETVKDKKKVFFFMQKCSEGRPL